MKSRISLIVIGAIFCTLLFGCDMGTSTENKELFNEKQDIPNVSDVTVESTDPFTVKQDIPDVSGVAISEGEVVLELTSKEDEILLTEDVLITNTTEINVSISGLSGDEEVTIYLYDAEYMDHYIAATTLSATQSKFTFSNLISITGYRVGAKTENLSDSRTLTITD